VKTHALIWISLALGSPLFLIAHGQSSGEAAGPWNGGKGRVIAELAAKSTDDDDDSSSPHSSTKKKKAASDDTDTSSSKASAARKKKKKSAQADDDAAGSTTDSGKKSSLSDGEPPSRKKKKPKDGGDDASTESKPKTPDDKLPKDVSGDASSAGVKKYGPDATVEPGAIADFASQPERVQHLIAAALDLTKLNLTYSYGSAEPSNGGMDCSGTIYYLLHSQGFRDVPRDSSGQYVWARKQGRFFAVVSTKADSFEFKDLMPGDLMFWSGTYQVERDIPISHVMLYLGSEKRTGKRIMFGSSDGRSYDGVQRWGVSVFDFKMPKNDPNNLEKRRVDFVGYARIPGLRESLDSSPSVAGAPEENNPPAKSAAAKEGEAKDADESTPPPKKKSGAKKATPRPRRHAQDSDSQ
jgi:cell wall-associated NlpC family hydrolase